MLKKTAQIKGSEICSQRSGLGENRIPSSPKLMLSKVKKVQANKQKFSVCLSQLAKQKYNSDEPLIATTSSPNLAKPYVGCRLTIYR